MDVLSGVLRFCAVKDSGCSRCNVRTRQFVRGFLYSRILAATRASIVHQDKCAQMLQSTEVTECGEEIGRRLLCWPLQENDTKIRRTRTRHRLMSR